MKNNKLQMPGKIVIEEQTNNYGIFSWGPLQKGFVYTIGNSLRRVLLSSMQGYAITKIRLPDSVVSEFDTIPGVSQDMAQIILNLKQVCFKKKVDIPHETIVLSVKDKKELKAGDIQAATNDFEILNPDLTICYLDESAEFEFQLTVEEGRGYSLAQDHKPKEQDLREVSIDAIFSPIINVEIKREDALVGNKADYEKLVIKITTNGAKTPEDALRESSKILCEHFSLLSIGKITSVYENEQKEENTNQEIENFRSLLKTPIDKLNLSPRVTNSLSAHHILDLGHIVTMKISDFMKFRNFGKKSLEELKQMLISRNLSFGIDIKGYSKKD